VETFERGTINLRKPWLVLGLILIFAGLASASSSSLPLTNTREELITDAFQTWEISATLDKGENVSALFTWTVDFTELYDGTLPANVSITVDNQYENRFQVLFKMVDPRFYEPPPGVLEYPVYVYSINLLHADPNSLALTNPPRQVGGITQQTGTYKVHVLIDEGLWWAVTATPTGTEYRPPRQLRLMRQVTTTTYPYITLGTVGAGITVLGVGLALWSAKTSTPSKTVKAAKTKLAKKGKRHK